MIYTVQFDFDIDQDEVVDCKAIEEHIKDSLSSASIDIREFKVLKIK